MHVLAAPTPAAEFALAAVVRPLFPKTAFLWLIHAVVTERRNSACLRQRNCAPLSLHQRSGRSFPLTCCLHANGGDPE